MCPVASLWYAAFYIELISLIWKNISGQDWFLYARDSDFVRFVLELRRIRRVVRWAHCALVVVKAYIHDHNGKTVMTMSRVYYQNSGCVLVSSFFDVV